MFNFIRNRIDKKSILNERQEINVVLNNIKEILEKSGNQAQCEVVQNLINLNNLDCSDKFIKELKGNAFWGGSGAVWEVYIQDINLEKDFEKNILNLMQIMKRAKIHVNGISQIENIFNENRSKYIK